MHPLLIFLILNLVMTPIHVLLMAGGLLGMALSGSMTGLFVVGVVIFVVASLPTVLTYFLLRRKKPGMGKAFLITEGVLAIAYAVGFYWMAQ